METRKIQQVGGGTYTVSLPKEWATEADIEPGSIVALHTHIDGTLVVRTDSQACEGTPPLTLTLATVDPSALERALRATYAAGIETVEIRAPDGNDEGIHRCLEGVTRTLTGVTVTETTGDSVRVRSLLDAEEVSITQSVSQLQCAVLSAHRDATAAVTGPKTVEHPDDRDGQAHRIFAMVDRYFQRGLDSLVVMDALGLTRPELFVRWATARELERIADEARRIAAVADRLEAPAAGEFADAFDDLADDTRGLVGAAVRLVVNDAEAATIQHVLCECHRIKTEARSLDRRLFETDDADYRLTQAIDSLARTAASAEIIAKFAFRSLVRASSRAESPLDVDWTESVESRVH